MISYYLFLLVYAFFFFFLLFFFFFSSSFFFFLLLSSFSIFCPLFLLGFLKRPGVCVCVCVCVRVCVVHLLIHESLELTIWILIFFRPRLIRLSLGCMSHFSFFYI
jgi:hypothetical protein